MMLQIRDNPLVGWLPGLLTQTITVLFILSWYYQQGVRATSGVAASITSSATSTSRQYDQSKHNRVLSAEGYITDEEHEADQAHAPPNFYFPEEEETDNYWREIKAIIGGVLGFWGGVGGLGTLFLVIVLSQRYCCRKSDEEKEGDG